MCKTLLCKFANLYHLRRYKNILLLEEKFVIAFLGCSNSPLKNFISERKKSLSILYRTTGVANKFIISDFIKAPSKDIFFTIY